MYRWEEGQTKTLRRKGRQERDPRPEDENINACFAPPPEQTDGGASHPSDRLRRRGPRSEESMYYRYTRNCSKTVTTSIGSEKSQREEGSETSQSDPNHNLSASQPLTQTRNPQAIRALDLDSNSDFTNEEPARKRFKIVNQNK